MAQQPEVPETAPSESSTTKPSTPTLPSRFKDTTLEDIKAGKGSMVIAGASTPKEPAKFTDLTDEYIKAGKGSIAFIGARRPKK